MHKDRPIVGVACDVKQIGIHPFHAVGEKYINAVAHGSGCLPVLLPALGKGVDLEALDDRIDPAWLVTRFDGIFLPGSASNLDPSALAKARRPLTPMKAHFATKENSRFVPGRREWLEYLDAGIAEVFRRQVAVLRQHVHQRHAVFAS